MTCIENGTLRRLDGTHPEWPVLRLGDVVTVHDSQRIPISEPDRQRRRGNYPYCGANGVLDSIDDYLYDGEYVLLAEDGGYWGGSESSSYLMRGRFWVNNHAHVLRGIPGVIENEFLTNALNYLDLTPFISGTTRGKLNQGVMSEISLPVPSIATQQATVYALQIVEKVKEARQHELSVERERKAGLMDYLFRHGTRGERSEVTEIGMIPDSWKVEPLDSLADLVSGGTPSRANAEWWNGTVPWASPKDMKSERLIDTQEHVSLEAIECGSRLVPAGTIFIVIRGMILAKDTPIAIAEVPMAFNQDMKAVLCHKNCKPEFLLHALMWRKGALAKHIGTSAHGTRRIGTDAVGSLRLPIPPPDEQSKIAAILDACEAKIIALENEIPLHEELFNSALDGFMTGRLSATTD